MEILNTWEEIVDCAEDLLVFIFCGLRERCAYAMSVVQREYPDAGNFQIPEGKAPRIRFADGIKMLKEAGIEASADEDIRSDALSYITASALFALLLESTSVQTSAMRPIFAL